MKKRVRKLFQTYCDIESNPQDFFEANKNKIYKENSIEYADNILYLIRSSFLIGESNYPHKKFSVALEIYQKKLDIAGEFFLLSTYIFYTRNYNDIEIATMVLSKAYDIDLEFNDFSIVVNKLLNHLFLTFEELESKSILEFFEGEINYVNQIDNFKIIGAHNYNYAYLLFYYQNYQKAKQYYFKSLYAFNKFYKNKNKPVILRLKLSIAELYVELREYQNAIDLYSKIYEASELTNNKNISYESLIGMVNLYEILEDYENAFKYLKIVKDKITQVQNYKNYNKSNKSNEYLSAELDYTKDKMYLANLELKRKSQELRKNLEHLNLILDVSKKITSTTDETDLFELVIYTIYKHISADSIILFLVNEEKRTINPKYVLENNEVSCYNEFSFDNKNSLSAYCARNRVDIFFKDLQEEYKKYIDEFCLTNECEEDVNDGSVIFCQLVDEGELIGILSIQHYYKNAYDEDVFNTIKSISSYVAIALSNSIKSNLLKEKSLALEKLSYYDELTGLENRRSFIEYSNFLTNEYISYKSISIIISDMNHLKSINDNLGHIEGDRYLIELAKVLKSLLVLNNDNKIFRLGGDEFVIIMIDSNEFKIIDYIKQVKEICASKKHSKYPLSVATGYAYSDKFIDVDKLFNEAETKMYADKSAYYSKNKFNRRT